jgi:hypothetical protein
LTKKIKHALLRKKENILSELRSNNSLENNPCDALSEKYRTRRTHPVKKIWNPITDGRIL